VSLPFDLDGKQVIVAAQPEYYGVPSYYLLDVSTGVPLTRWLQGRATIGKADDIRPTFTDDSGTWLPVPISLGLESESGTVNAHVSYSLLGVETRATPLRHARLGSTLMIAGAIPLQYDGVRLTEYGFLSEPHVSSYITPSPPGPLQAGKTYAYVAVWEDIDAAGRRHRSAASDPVTYTVPGGYASGVKANVTVEALNATRRPTAVLALYRTLGNTPDVYYRVSSYAAPTVNDPAVRMLPFTDTVADSELAAHEILYTVGGEIDNDSPPSCTTVFASRERFWVAGGDDAPDSVFYSKTGTRTHGPGFSLAFERRIETPAGPVTAIGATEGRVLAFKENAIVAWSGEGPNNAGTNDDFSAPFVLTRTVGCDNDAALFTDEREGVYFAHRGVVWLVNRSTDVVRVGAAVAPRTGAITSAVAVSGEPRVRFGLPDGQALYHPMLTAPYPGVGNVGAWRTYGAIPQVGATEWKGRYFCADPNAFVRVENDTYLDAGQTYRVGIDTAWLRIGAPGGAATFQQFALLGAREGEHRLVVGVAYDYRPMPLSTVEFDSVQGLSGSTYGQDDYGAEPWGGLSDDMYMLRGQLAVQTGEANVIRFSFSDGAAAGLTLENSFVLDSLTLTGQEDPGLARVRRSKYLGG